MNSQDGEYPVNLLQDIFYNETLPDYTATYFHNAFVSVINKLPDKTRQVILLRYRDKETYREIGEKFGVGKVRARDIVLRGLRLLRHPNRKRELRGMNPNDYKTSNPTIDELEVSARAFNCLKQRGFKTVSEIANLSASELKQVRHLGKKTYHEIVDLLGELGYDISKY